MAILALALLAAGPASRLHPGKTAEGGYVTPQGQRLQPWGRRVAFDGHPDALAATYDGQTLVAVSGDTLQIIDAVSGVLREEKIPSPFPGERVLVGRTGIVVEGGTAWIPFRTTNAEHAAVARYNLTARRFESAIIVPPSSSAHYHSPLLAGITGAASGRLYVAASGDNHVIALDSQRALMLRSQETDVAPMEVSAGYGYVAVASVGGPWPRESDEVRFSGDTGEAVAIDPHSGRAQSGSVDLYDAGTLEPRGTVNVGQHPVGMVFTSRATLLVSCAQEDDIYVIDVSSGRAVARVPIVVPGVTRIGLQPQQMALSADGHFLYVALAGINAVAVYDLLSPRSWALRGLVPTDWYPAALAALPNGGVAVANLKGIGSVAAIDKRADRFAAHGFRGSVTILSRADIASANRQSTTEVVNLAGNDALESHAKRPPIAHVVLVIRENMPYDTEMGDDPSGDGDPSLTRYGAGTTPNSHELASRYVLLDNSYAIGSWSADGHQWLTQATDTEYLEHQFNDFSRSYPFQGGDPLAYAATGFLWQDALARGRTVRDYGEFVPTVLNKSLKWSELWRARERHERVDMYTHSDIPSLDHIIDRAYPGFELRISDQARIDEFEHEFERAKESGKWFDVVLLALPNDHTAGTAADYPKPNAMVADNDYALGRLVEDISHSSFWRNTAIFVVEDDTQNGYDHVEGHRAVTLVAGPWFRRRSVNSTLYSHLSVLHTMEWLLGMPPMNHNDASAAIMLDTLSDTPDYAPYTAIKPQQRLDELNPKVTTLSGMGRAIARRSAMMAKDRPDGDPIVLRAATFSGR